MRRVWTVVLFILSTGVAHAHKPSDSYLNLSIQGSHIEGQWDVALRDLDYAIGLDSNDDGQITWGELRARHTEIAAYVLSRLQLRGAGALCPSLALEHLVDNHSDGAYAILKFSAKCPTPPEHLELTYSLFSELDPQHKGLLNLQYHGLVRTAIFGVEKPLQGFELASTNPWRQFLDFVREGIWHIWIGYDHILFLLALLLPAVLWRKAGQWVAVADFRGAGWNVLKIVTAFTVAHSITLSLAALSIIQLPSRLVESAIAVSIVASAANNIRPLIHTRLWMVAFIFGLVHGFGFASVLMGLNLPQGALLSALVGFNLGVEIGQLAIVAIFFPLAFLLRCTRMYQCYTLGAGSLMIAIVATLWMAERIFNVTLLPI